MNEQQIKELLEYDTEIKLLRPKKTKSSKVVYNVVRFKNDFNFSKIEDATVYYKESARIIRVWDTREAALRDIEGCNKKYNGIYTFHLVTKKVKS
jgi:hypothetical protein